MEAAFQHLFLALGGVPLERLDYILAVDRDLVYFGLAVPGDLNYYILGWEGVLDLSVIADRPSKDPMFVVGHLGDTSPAAVAVNIGQPSLQLRGWCTYAASWQGQDPAFQQSQKALMD